MKRSELRDIIKEELLSEGKDQKAFSDVINHLRTKVYPKLNDDEVYDLNVKLKTWFNKNV